MTWAGGPIRWECPNCTQTALTPGLGVAPGEGGTRMHQCAGTRGLLVPMVPAGTDAKIEAREREDYEGADTGRTQLDPERGRPVMAVVVTHASGRVDTCAYAPVAVASRRDYTHGGLR